MYDFKKSLTLTNLSFASLHLNSPFLCGIYNRTSLAVKDLKVEGFLILTTS